MIESALSGIRILALTSNVPGPLALRSLVDLGADAVKIEPLGGDPLELVAPEWYASLSRGIEVRRLDLKNADAIAELRRHLERADIFLTTVRPRALANLQLDGGSLAGSLPRLCQVQITGYPPPDDDRPGHDLNYQAEAGLLAPPALPRALIADFAGAERAVSAALALLLGRERNGKGGHACVALADAARDFARPLHEGLVGDDGILGGATSFYRCYLAADGCWVACGLLERRFIETFGEASGLEDFDEEALADFFAKRKAADWVQWGRDRDLPISLVR